MHHLIGSVTTPDWLIHSMFELFVIITVFLYAMYLYACNYSLQKEVDEQGAMIFAMAEELKSLGSKNVVIEYLDE
jgi:hypothetical protein